MRRLLLATTQCLTGYSSRHFPVNNVLDSVVNTTGVDVLFNYFHQLEAPEDLVPAEYVWHDSQGNLRSKTKCLEKDKRFQEVTMDDLTEADGWAYDGSSTDQASGGNSDIILRPVAMCKDPFRPGRAVIVLCETLDSDGRPLKDNHRHECAEVFSRPEVEEQEWIFAFEQEYFLYQNGVPLGWPEDVGEFPVEPQGPYYCGLGANHTPGRVFSECHLHACLYAGLAFGGINAEVALGQWEYQIGPIGGVEVADQLELSRYFMHRIGELMNLSVEMHPKPVFSGFWNGSGNHCNCSSKPMREEGGLDIILEACEKLGTKHPEHISEYGDHNELRLSGKFETQHIEQFSFGIADRGSSIRLTRTVYDNGQGHFEDRRPASNCSPYRVTSRIVKTLMDLDDMKYADIAPNGNGNGNGEENGNGK